MNRELQFNEDQHNAPHWLCRIRRALRHVMQALLPSCFRWSNRECKLTRISQPWSRAFRPNYNDNLCFLLCHVTHSPVGLVLFLECFECLPGFSFLHFFVALNALVERYFWSVWSPHQLHISLFYHLCVKQGCWMGTMPRAFFFGVSQASLISQESFLVWQEALLEFLPPGFPVNYQGMELKWGEISL